MLPDECRDRKTIQEIFKENCMMILHVHLKATGLHQFRPKCKGTVVSETSTRIKVVFFSASSGQYFTDFVRTFCFLPSSFFSFFFSDNPVIKGSLKSKSCLYVPFIISFFFFSLLLLLLFFFFFFGCVFCYIPGHCHVSKV